MSNLDYCQVGEHMVPKDYFVPDLHEHACLMCLRNQPKCPVCQRELSVERQEDIRRLVVLIVDEPEDEY